MVNILFIKIIHIFQTEHFSAVKVDMGYKKLVSYLVIPKFPKHLGKKK